MSLKHLVFRLLGKDPEAVVVTFLSGPRDLALGMLDEIRRLVPDREHYAVTLDDEPLVSDRGYYLVGPAAFFNSRIGARLLAALTAGLTYHFKRQ